MSAALASSSLNALRLSKATDVKEALTGCDAVHLSIDTVDVMHLFNQ